MRAQLVWRPGESNRTVKVTVRVTPTELASLRYALALPPEQLGESVASIYTYSAEKPVGRRAYRLKSVESITPFTVRKRQVGDTS